MPIGTPLETLNSILKQPVAGEPHGVPTSVPKHSGPWRPISRCCSIVIIKRLVAAPCEHLLVRARYRHHQGRVIAPVLILEPVKPVAAYLVSTGSFSAGMTILVVGEILKLIIVERLFKLCRYKLLKIPYGWTRFHI